jgi:hypothetical protein
MAGPASGRDVFTPCLDRPSLMIVALMTAAISATLI